MKAPLKIEAHEGKLMIAFPMKLSLGCSCKRG
jgi:hypothetical protein